MTSIHNITNLASIEWLKISVSRDGEMTCVYVCAKVHSKRKFEWYV